MYILPSPILQIAQKLCYPENRTDLYLPIHGLSCGLSRTSGNCKTGHKSHTERQTFLCAVQLHGFPNSLLPCTFCHNEGTADPLAYGRFPYAFPMF